MATLLLIEDEFNILDVLRRILASHGHTVLTSMNLEQARDQVMKNLLDLVITDQRLPDGSGLDLLREIKEQYPEMPIMMMTAYGSIENAVEAIKAGADDYVVKPFRVEEIEHKVTRLLKSKQLQEQNTYLSHENNLKFGQLIGQSEAMQTIYHLIEKVASTESTVLITGESGTGKEMVARTLHQKSHRASGPFITVHCAAYSQNLIESELFGHEKGAFTGATGLRKGRLEISDGGTLFLDELGEIPLEIQVKLLKFLENKVFERVGSNQPIKVDVRIIAATHRDLKEMIKAGKFREDLYWRMNVFPIELPPLRERKDDIILLAHHFMATKAPGKQLKLTKFSERILLDYSWPGNVRELENIIERAVILSTQESLRVDAALTRPSQEVTLGQKNINQILEEIEKKLIQEALGHSGGNQAQAAKLLGIQRSTLQYKLNKYNLISER